MNPTILMYLADIAIGVLGIATIWLFVSKIFGFGDEK